MNVSSFRLSSVASRWFLLASICGGLFLIYTLLYGSGLLNNWTLETERWLLGRPLTRVDCMFHEWRYIGEVPVSLVLTAIIGLVCWRAGYGWKIIPLLLVLLLLGTGIEVVGKKLFVLTIPHRLYEGMTILGCPQMWRQPASVRTASFIGWWPDIPDTSSAQVSWLQTVAQMPFAGQNLAWTRSYPGGHAMRWMFIGLLATWLCWQHLRSTWLRLLLTSICTLLAFAGGLMQFYVAVHTLDDTISGDLLGAALAFCAIGFLVIVKQARNRDTVKKDFFANQKRSALISR